MIAPHDWIFDDPPSTNFELLDRIHQAEEALGFKLFYWQKSYILNGTLRHYGATTAAILQDLLAEPDTQTITLQYATSEFYRNELIHIKRILSEHGVPSANVILPNGKLFKTPTTRDKKELHALSTSIRYAKACGLSKQEIRKAFEEAMDAEEK